MCSMGLGAMFIPRALYEKCISGLLKVELILSVLGASSVMLLSAAFSLGLKGTLSFALLTC